MQHVAIPSSFFLDEAKHEYFDHRTRLVQELLQNSLDAGATGINLNFDVTGYSCEDNGRGMTRERMVSALLTMGGSVKESGATGGFGAAKKLLLFAHKTYSIWSNDTYVEGAGLSYNFQPTKSRQGTRVVASYSDENSFLDMEIKAIMLLEKCNFRGRCKVYVNGKLFTMYASARHAKTIDGLGEVYANKGNSPGKNVVSVLHNGLFMFDRYISDLNRVVIVEVTGKSTDLFTQNRDGFKGDYRPKFDSVCAEMSIDKLSIVKPRPRKFVLSGIAAYISFIGKKFVVSSVVEDAICSVRLAGGDYHTVESFAIAVEKEVSRSIKATEVDKASVNLMTKCASTGKITQSDFHFDLSDSSFRKVPDKFLPNAGKPKYTSLARTWKVCIREVLKANGLNQSFVVGFTFNSNAVATHSMNSGVSCYLINPLCEAINEGNKEEKTMKILTTAVHEVVHSQGCQCHDEEFVLTFHKLLVPTLTKAMTWRQIVKASKIEKL